MVAGLGRAREGASAPLLNKGGAMSPTDRLVAEWVGRVRSEYLEMPDLALTRWQMRRLWFLDAPLCDAVVDALVASGFLCRGRNNTYVRVHECS